MSAALASDSEFTRERLRKGGREGGRGWGGGEVLGGKRERERDNPEMSPYSDGNISSLDGLRVDSNTGRSMRWRR